MVTSSTWREQAAASSEVDIRPVPSGRKSMRPGADMLYPTAMVILAEIQQIPTGETLTLRELRERLARRHDVEYVCPVTATRSLRLLAEAANEGREAGDPPDQIPPVWRVLNAKATCLRTVSFDPIWLTDERQREHIAD